MRDITQIAGSDIVMFSAESPAADLWMKELYGRPKIYFNLPVDSANAMAFAKAARAQGFSIATIAADPADSWRTQQPQRLLALIDRSDS
jgi:hypothetical protein